MKWIVRSVFLPTVTLVVGAIAHFGYLYTHCEFQPNDFYHPKLVNQTAFPLSVDASLKAQAREVLNQQFIYMGRGRQMTAYVSADGQYVIKFFNPRTFLRKKWFYDRKKLRRMVSLKWLSKAYFKRQDRLARLSKRYQLAFDELKEESGLIYVHLSPASQLHTLLQLTDKAGARCSLDLNGVPFVLQKKSQLVLSQLDALMQKRDFKEIKEKIGQLYTLFSLRALKGYTDRVQTLHNNYGFIGDRAIQIDLGGIYHDYTIAKDPKADIQRIMERIARTLFKRYPGSSSLLMEIFKELPPSVDFQAL